MKAKTNNNSASHMQVRFSKIYAFIFILLSHAPFVFALQQIVALKRDFFQDGNFIVPSIAFLLGFLIIAAGISHPTRWYLRLDRDKKLLLLSRGIRSWSKKHPYDTIFFSGDKFHLEKNGIKKTIGFMKFNCNKNDLKSMTAALKEPL